MLQKKIGKFICIILMLTFSLLKSQVYTLDQLESITEKYRKKDDIQGAIDFNKDALKIYYKVNNADGIVAAQLNIANYLSVSNNFKESMKYLDESEKYITKIKNPEIISKFYASYGMNYSRLSLYEQSNAKLDKAINFANRIEDKKKKKLDFIRDIPGSSLISRECKSLIPLKKSRKNVLLCHPILFYTLILRKDF
ncbi:hypothetical protein [Chryseobacterium sp. MMS23-Vi53]|uniref:hypothetical protein n=1 Tax=Chryseobacterium sp. MMS23-Vi53 TaxID=3386644 RepID=UPI0039E8AD2B